MSSELHPEVRELLDLMKDAGMPSVSSLSVSGARDFLANRFTGEYLGERFSGDVEPDPVESVRDFTLRGPDGDDLPVRIYAPGSDGPYPVVVWFHGGGWVLGDLDSADAECRALANAADCVVVSVDYRLAPEHPFPAGFEDCYAAVEWVAGNPGVVGGDGTVAVGGPSAGGNLAAAVALAAVDRGGPDLAAQVLVYPVVNHPATADMASYEENGEGYLVSTADMAWFHGHYVDRPVDVANPYAYPLGARDLSGVAPATVLTAGFDPLRDEGVAYADRLAGAGVTVRRHHYEDVIHGFYSMLLQPEAPRAREAVGAVAEDLRAVVDD